MSDTNIPHRYFVLNKPINMLSQFVGHNTGNMLGKINFDFPEGTHAIGRLDNMTEGLLLLTTDKRITRLLFKSKIPHKRCYLAQVEAKISEADIQALRDGVRIPMPNIGHWDTGPCLVELIDEPDPCYNIVNTLHPRHPYKWLKLTLTEGKYRQIRKMITAVGNRCKRLVRISIEDLDLAGIAPGTVREYSEAEFFRLLKLEKTID
jgi:23S rRNA pseudouridine2457 synthase